MPVRKSHHRRKTRTTATHHRKRRTHRTSTSTRRPARRLAKTSHHRRANKSTPKELSKALHRMTKIHNTLQKNIKLLSAAAHSAKAKSTGTAKATRHKTVRRRRRSVGHH